MSPTYFRFVSQVAGEFKKSCPEKFISVLSYVNTLPRPAGMNLPDNVILLTAPIGRNYAKPLSADEYHAGIIKSWNDEHQRPRFFAYEYYAGVYANLSMPFPVLHELSADMKWYRQIGFGGLCSQAEEDNWGAYGLTAYALARLSWNPELPVDQLLAGYCDAFYGPASASMQKYLLGDGYRYARAEGRAARAGLLQGSVRRDQDLRRDGRGAGFGSRSARRTPTHAS